MNKKGFHDFSFICGLVVALSLNVAQGQSLDQERGSLNLPFEEIVRQKLYPGGIDEQPLTVQDPLYIPWRSMNLLQVQKETLDEVMSGPIQGVDDDLPPGESADD